MEYYRQTAGQVMQALNASKDGLAPREAANRLRRFGRNKLKEKKKESLFQRFLQQMADPMIVVLLAAAGVSAITALSAGESMWDVWIILAVVIVNALLGVYQESKAEKAIEALQKMAAAQSKVLRGGHILTVQSEELVPGDVVLLEAGDAVPADGRLLEAVSLKMEEAALTGESLPIEKTSEPLPGNGKAPLGDRHCMAYMGSMVSYGRGRLLVTETGMNTEMGQIAGVLADTAQGKTPLQEKLSALSKTLSVLVLAICVFIFGFGLWQAEDVSLHTVLGTFMVAVSLAVAAVPEGLAAVVTVVLSTGVTRMSRQGAVIRRLTAVETLGCAEVICSDKTGTLTQNRMEVKAHYGQQAPLAAALALCNDAEWESGKPVGEATECALLNYAVSLGQSKASLNLRAPRKAELPFDSARKLMTTFHKEEGRTDITQYTKGAPDVLLERCTHFMQQGRAVPFTAAERTRILTENRRMAGGALRVLAAAVRYWPSLPARINPQMAEQQMIFLGLVGMMDPVRPEVAPAIAECRRAGIRPIMITGDHKETAVAIGRELGILTGTSGALTGAELDKLSDTQLQQQIGNYSVYARVQPQHKVRIVKAWQAQGKTVAMTGDGVNDSPALKSADIGVGMGITGTDVTKNVADMVLADDNFATIVTAVAEGRRVYDNIRKAIQFLLASNMSEVLSIFVSTLLGITLLKPAHLLWINLITDCFPALALGMEQPEKNVMQRPPRPRGEGIFAGGVGFDVFWQGALVTALTLAAYMVGIYLETGIWQLIQSGAGVSMAFLTMSMTEIFHSFNMRSQRGSVFAIKGHNHYLWAAMLASLLLSTGVLFWEPAAMAFGFETITLREYFVSMGMAVSVIPLVEIGKALLRATGKKPEAEKNYLQK